MEETEGFVPPQDSPGCVGVSWLGGTEVQLLCIVSAVQYNPKTHGEKPVMCYMHL